jgi:hypothetical protein
MVASVRPSGASRRMSAALDANAPAAGLPGTITPAAGVATTGAAGAAATTGARLPFPNDFVGADVVACACLAFVGDEVCAEARPDTVPQATIAMTHAATTRVRTERIIAGSDTGGATTF